MEAHSQQNQSSLTASYNVNLAYQIETEALGLQTFLGFFRFTSPKTFAIYLFTLQPP